MEVGSHCSLSSCNTLDFLPVPCDHCRLLFCRDHFLASSHGCPEAPEPPAPRSDGAPPQRYPCSVKGCSKAELAPVHCPSCEVSFSSQIILRHASVSRTYPRQSVCKLVSW